MEIFFAEIPGSLRFIFMALQSLAVFLFVFYFSEIKASLKLLFAISLAKIILKNWYESTFVLDFISALFLNIVVNILLVLAFTRIYNYKVVITATLASIVLLITLPSVTLWLIKYYPSTHPHIVWFIARLPQFAILNLIVLWAYRTDFMHYSNYQV